MPFTFPRVSAGIYEVQKNSNTVGFIRKASASKWIVTDVVDTPQHVTKTLKEAKDACVNLIIFNEVDKVSEDEYNTFVEVDENSVETSKNLNGSLTCYKQVSGTDEFVKVSNTEFGFAEPTLDPIVF